MAKTELNSALRHISGGIDNWVYRNTGGRVIICRRGINHTPPSAAQTAVRERFRLAADFAQSVRSDPALRATYEAVAQNRGISLQVAVMTDYLTPPVVNAIDLSSYQGRIGDVIRVRAVKDAGVVAVNLAIRDAALNVLEEGAAMLQNGLWVYTATTAIVLDPTIKVTATAVDRPGNTGSKTQPLA